MLAAICPKTAIAFFLALASKCGFITGAFLPDDSSNRNSTRHALENRVWIKGYRVNY
jgi:hypothetical protein